MRRGLAVALTLQAKSVMPFSGRLIQQSRHEDATQIRYGREFRPTFQFLTVP
jgi:hypothetical protein